MYLADYHVHSTCSPDGRQTMAQAAGAAVAAGLQELCFTDHVDTFYWSDFSPRSQHDWAEEWRQFRQAREQWGDRIALRMGAELGDAQWSLERAAQLMDGQQLDFIIGSVHLAGDDFGRMDLYDVPRGTEDYYHRFIDSYLTELASLVQWGGFHVVGHLSLPLRYINEHWGEHMTFDAHMEQVEALLRRMIDRGIGLECNTNRGGEPLPGADILRLYRRLGGELITLGSDAHRPEDVGRSIAQTQQLLRDCGFRWFATFTGGQPQQHPL